MVGFIVCKTGKYVYKGVQIGQPSVKDRYVNKGVLSGQLLSVKQVNIFTKEY